MALAARRAARLALPKPLSTRILDGAFRLTTLSLVGFCAYAGVVIVHNVYSLHSTRVKWEKAHPEEVAQFYIRKQKELEDEETEKKEVRRVKKERLLQLLKEEEIQKQQKAAITDVGSESTIPTTT